MANHIHAALRKSVCACVCVCVWGGCMWLNVCHHSNTPGDGLRGQPGLGVWLTTPGNQSALEFLADPYQRCRIGIWLAPCGLGMRIRVWTTDLEGLAEFIMSPCKIKPLPSVCACCLRPTAHCTLCWQRHNSASHQRHGGPRQLSSEQLSIKTTAHSSFFNLRLTTSRSLQFYSLVDPNHNTQISICV